MAREAKRDPVTGIGVDAGATLLKLVVDGAAVEAGAAPELRFFPTTELDRCVEAIRAAGRSRIGLTGGAAPDLAQRLGFANQAGADAFLQVTELEAWARGADRLLRELGQCADDPYLLVSLGTGCSAMRVGPESATRVGGTALGGGTILGLGAALVGTREFSELTALAAKGDRRKVDLLVGDIAGGANIPLPRELNAASFAKLACADLHAQAESRDLAHAIMGMVGENVGIICSGLARNAGVGRIVYGGSTLRDNAPLADVLRLMALASGLDPVILPNGEFTGALGALEIAASPAAPIPGNPEPPRQRQAG